jgi:hypothetical protein
VVCGLWLDRRGWEREAFDSALGLFTLFDLCPKLKVRGHRGLDAVGRVESPRIEYPVLTTHTLFDKVGR